MNISALAILLFGLGAATIAASAASLDLSSEVAAINAGIARKDYAEAIPHAERAAALARDDASVTAAERIDLLTVLAQLYYYEADYVRAERTLRDVVQAHRAAGDNPHVIAVSQEDLAELLDLQGKSDQAAALHAAAAAALQTPFRGGSARSALGRRDPTSAPPGTPIRESVYDFFDAAEREDGGYGRYTYVVLTPKKERGTALLTTLLDAPAGTTVASVNRAVVNAFEIPVVAGRRRDALGASAPAADGTPSGKAERLWALYDFSAANNLLLAACKAPAVPATDACRDLGAGPYLLTFTRAFNAYASPPSPYLIVDMSNMQPSAFAYIVKTMQHQLERSDLANIKDGGAVNSMQTSLLNTVLVAKDWITPIDDSVAGWIKVIFQK